MAIKVLQDFVLVEPIEEQEDEESTSGGIILLAKTKEKTESVRSVKVVQVGPGKTKPIMGIKAGDTIVIPHYAGIDIKVSSDKQYTLVRATEVLAVIEEEEK